MLTHTIPMRVKVLFVYLKDPNYSSNWGWKNFISVKSPTFLLTVIQITIFIISIAAYQS